MKNFIKFVKELKSKGFATSEEKAEALALFKDLDSDEQEVVETQKEEVESLPEEAPAEDPADDDSSDEDAKAEVEKGIKAMFKDAVDDIKSEVKEFMKEQAELREKGAGVYNEEVKDKRKALNDYTRALLGALAGEGSTKEKAEAKLKEMTTDATGSPYAGYVVDSELSAEILHLITEYGVAAKEMNAIQLSKNSYKANTLATDVSVSWVSEGSAIGSTQAVLGQSELTLNKLTAISSFTSELLEDEEIDLVSFVASRVAEGIAQAEDEAFFKGDGTSTYGSFTGLLNNTSTNAVTLAATTFASLDADDLIDAVDATPAGALANAKFYMHRSIMSLVRKLKDSQNAYIYQPISASGPATIWGYPVVTVEAMPTTSDTAADTAFILFGDLKKAAIYGYKGGLRVDRFNSGVVRNVADSADINLITTDREAVRWVKRVGYIAILPTAVTRIKTAAASA